MSRLARALLLAAASALLVTGCVAQPQQQPQPQLDEATSSELVAGVVAAAESAADDDPKKALKRLDELEKILLQATADGRVSADKSAQIMAAIELVRRDLQAMLDAESPGNSDKNNGNGNGKKDD
ncbi:MAG: hypothetical protein ABL886_05730 [Rhodoglobus sp.]